MAQLQQYENLRELNESKKIELDFEPLLQSMRVWGTPGCHKECLGKDKCVIGWSDGSCGAKPQGTQWPEQQPTIVVNDGCEDTGNRPQEEPR